MNIAFHFLEVSAKGNKRCLNFLVGGGHDEIRFRRKDGDKEAAGLAAKKTVVAKS
jgi:hypothetical protein